MIFYQKVHLTRKYRCAQYLSNKPAGQTAGQTLPDATPPVGQIHPFSEIAVTFEPIQQLDTLQDLESRNFF